MAVDKNKNKQVLVTFPDEMLEEIESFWYEQKFMNRNETIRALVQYALDNKDGYHK
ncbi:ribbon-helix-helix domain-containing protein [Salicibibacter kimchii]|uniref:ribbon-helix-helix domain-containing protein n=1 Tax=Salicibibacter kimchii TaxID=2099786 RepID=UPI001876A401|nr:ribbon-helix-helix domain-containing protein [Salicibibacter kimchii]